MINFLNLEYFLVAAEELNFTKAAKRLYISQQSLSNHISNLEKEFDIALFHRTTPLTLTYAGQVLEKRAREILELREETYHEIADIKDFSKGKLIIGMSHTRGRKILPEILPLYKEQFPNIDLQLIEGNSSELDAGLLHGEIDLIIGMLPFKVENIETVPLCDEEILLAVPNKVLEHAYPGQVEKIKEQLLTNADLRLLQNCPFLLINPATGSALWQMRCSKRHRSRPTSSWKLKTSRRSWRWLPKAWELHSTQRCSSPATRYSRIIWKTKPG